MKKPWDVTLLSAKDVKLMDAKDTPIFFYYFSSPNSIPDSVCWSFRSDIQQLWVKGPFKTVGAAKKAIREGLKERQMTAYERRYALFSLREQKMEEVKHFTQDIGTEENDK